MSRISDILIEIEEMLASGMMPNEVAKALDIPVSWVYETEERLTGADEPWDGFNSDAEADADALASAGWGTDEDYVVDNDYFDGEF